MVSFHDILLRNLAIFFRRACEFVPIWSTPSGSLSLRRDINETIGELMDGLGNGTVTTLIVTTLAFSAGAFLNTSISGRVPGKPRSRARADLVELQAKVEGLNASFAQLQERVSNLEKRQAARRRGTPTPRKNTR